MFPISRCFQFKEIAEALGEGAVIGGLIAQVEGERFFLVGGRAIAREGQVLEANSALAKPVMLGHALDEDFFGGSGGLVFAAERVEELIEGVLVFGGEHREDGAETVFEGVATGDGFASFGGRSGGAKGVLAVDFGARAALRLAGGSGGDRGYRGRRRDRICGDCGRLVGGLAGEFAQATLFGAADLTRCHTKTVLTCGRKASGQEGREVIEERGEIKFEICDSLRAGDRGRRGKEE